MSNQYFGDDRIVHETLDVPKASSHRIYSDSESSDDIVIRLRSAALTLFQNGADSSAFLYDHAADEIERLRADLENVRDMNEQLTEELQTYYSEDELNADWE